MANNVNLLKSRSSKNDEFYTPYGEIADELQHYTSHFDGKTIFCNCDDPKRSNFVKYFVGHFKEYGLKKLVATTMTDTGSGIRFVYDGMRVETVTMQGNGDFRREECVELLKAADIVVTNPPFSLFNEYVGQLLAYEKRFIIIGNKNAITHNDISEYIKENKLWSGCRSFKGDMWFETEEGMVNVSGCWFTNLDHHKRHVPLKLTRRYSPKEYRKYDNYDGIEVGRVKDIPRDYKGVMGVPITFCDKYCPDQFEIVGFRRGNDGRNLHLNGRQVYFRILIRTRSAGSAGKN